MEDQPKKPAPDFKVDSWTPPPVKGPKIPSPDQFAHWVPPPIVRRPSILEILTFVISSNKIKITTTGALLILFVGIYFLVNLPQKEIEIQQVHSLNHDFFAERLAFENDLEISVQKPQEAEVTNVDREVQLDAPTEDSEGLAFVIRQIQPLLADYSHVEMWGDVEGGVSFGWTWMARFGAEQQILEFGDLDLDHILVGEVIERGASQGNVNITIPLRVGAVKTLRSWEVDAHGDESPWDGGVPPGATEQSRDPVIFSAKDKSAGLLLGNILRSHAQPDMDQPVDLADLEKAEQILEGERYPETRTRLVEAHEFEKLTFEEVRYAINEMFARRGAVFGSPDVSAQFRRFDWYQPREGTDFDEIQKSFSDIESANLKTLGTVRDGKR